jgi:predicted DNA-binding protein
MTTKVATFPLRLPVSLKTALETISDRDGTSINQFLVVAAAEKIAAMQTEEFFLARRNRADREAFRRISIARAGKLHSLKMRGILPIPNTLRLPEEVKRRHSHAKGPSASSRTFRPFSSA